MTRLIIAAIVALFASPALATEVPNTDLPKADAAKSTAPKGDAAKSSKKKISEDVAAFKGNMTRDEKIAAANKLYYDKAAAEKGTVRTGSGLLYKSLKEGSGATPGIMSTVKVHYRGTLINHYEFKNTYKSGTPAEHKLNRVFRCWQEGLLKMKVGGKAKLVCPPEIAFRGNGAAGVVPPNAVVTYEIELLGIK